MAKSNTGGAHWVTINGAHIMIGGGSGKGALPATKKAAAQHARLTKFAQNVRGKSSFRDETRRDGGKVVGRAKLNVSGFPKHPGFRY